MVSDGGATTVACEDLRETIARTLDLGSVWLVHGIRRTRGGKHLAAVGNGICGEQRDMWAQKEHRLHASICEESTAAAAVDQVDSVLRCSVRRTLVLVASMVCRESSSLASRSAVHIVCVSWGGHCILLCDETLAPGSVEQHGLVHILLTRAQGRSCRAGSHCCGMKWWIKPVWHCVIRTEAQQPLRMVRRI